MHRHEPPVVGRPLEILEDNGEVLVVDKPASMPVHPCGRFRHNTVIFILGKERGICGLHTVHRLDRLTSGVLLFARTLEVSQKLDVLVRDRQVRHPLVQCAPINRKGTLCLLIIYTFFFFTYPRNQFRLNRASSIISLRGNIQSIFYQSLISNFNSLSSFTAGEGVHLSSGRGVSRG